MRDGEFSRGREMPVTIDTGDGPKIAKPIWYKLDRGPEVPAWQTSDGKIFLESELFPSFTGPLSPKLSLRRNDS